MSNFRMTIKQAMSTIKLISKAGATLDARIHEVAVSGLAHYGEHGDLTTLTELCHAMPKSGRGNALKLWCTKHVGKAQIKWNAKAYSGKGGFVKANTLSAVDIDLCITSGIKEAEAEPFYEKRDTEQSDYNMLTSVTAFKAKLVKHVDAIPDGKGAEYRALLDALVAFEAKPAEAAKPADTTAEAKPVEMPQVKLSNVA